MKAVAVNKNRKNMNNLLLNCDMTKCTLVRRITIMRSMVMPPLAPGARTPDRENFSGKPAHVGSVKALSRNI